MKYSNILSIALYSAISLSTDAFLVKQSTRPMHQIRHRQNAPLQNRHVNLGIPRGGQTMIAPDTKLALTFDNAPFTGSLSIYAAINALGFVISILTGSHLHLDLLGTGAFTLASLPTLLSATSLRVTLSSAAVCTWGAKLAGFLFFRALKVKTDGRLDGTLSTASGACEYTYVMHRLCCCYLL